MYTAHDQLPPTAHTPAVQMRRAKLHHQHSTAQRSMAWQVSAGHLGHTITQHTSARMACSSSAHTIKLLASKLPGRGRTAAEPDSGVCLGGHLSPREDGGLTQADITTCETIRSWCWLLVLGCRTCTHTHTQSSPLTTCLPGCLLRRGPCAACIVVGSGGGGW